MSQGLGMRLAITLLISGSSVTAMAAMGEVSSFNGVFTGGSRFTSVTQKNQSVNFWGYSDTLAEPTCAFQQKSDSSMAPLGCSYPTTGGAYTDPCGITWYPYQVNVTLNAANAYWFGRNNATTGEKEYTQVFLSRNTSDSGLYTLTGDWTNGPSEYGPTCWRTLFQTNSAVAPMTIYHNGVPTDFGCQGTNRPFAACPFTCNQPDGCDFLTGERQWEFSNSNYRLNSSSQDTSQTEWDHYGHSGAYSPPAGNWFYGWESRACVGGTYNGLSCTQDYNCAGGYCGPPYYVVMRRDTYTGDSLNIRRGESRRNSKVEAWVKNTGSGYYYRYLGLISRFYNSNNYFAFKLSEYGSDHAYLERLIGGSIQGIASIVYPSFNMYNNWTRIGLEVRDRGSYTNGGFVPNGNCYVGGILNGSTVTSVASTLCNFAPVGSYGTYSHYNYGAQYYDVDAYPLAPLP